MRKYLLDTTPLTAFLLGRKRAVEMITPWLKEKEVVTSIVVYGEVDEYLKILHNYNLLHLQLRRQLQEIKPCAMTRYMSSWVLSRRNICPARLRRYITLRSLTRGGPTYGCGPKPSAIRRISLQKCCRYCDTLLVPSTL